MNKIYKKNEYIVVPVGNDFLIININKIFKTGHTHVKSLDICKLLISLVINKKIPKNVNFVDNLIRISVDKNYIKRLEKLKEDSEEIYIRDLMKATAYKRHKGALRQIR